MTGNKYYDQAKYSTELEIGSMLQDQLEQIRQTGAQGAQTVGPKRIGPQVNTMMNPNQGAQPAPEQTQQAQPLPGLVDADTMSGINEAVQTALNQQMTPQYAPVPQASSRGAFDDVYNLYSQEIARREKERQAAIEADPKLRRGEDARKWMVGIGDALASVANLVGTAHNASNQKQVYGLPGVDADIERERAQRLGDLRRRQNEIDDLYGKMLGARLAGANAQSRESIQNIKNDFNITKEGNRHSEAVARQAGIDAKNAADQANKDRKADLDAQKAQASIDEINSRIDKNRAQVSQGWAKLQQQAAKNGAGAAKASVGIGAAKANYNEMLDEIATDSGYADWQSVMEASRAGDTTARTLYNQFDLGKDKAGNAKIEGMISHYAEDFAPEFFRKYFGQQATNGSKTLGLTGQKKSLGLSR